MDKMWGIMASFLVTFLGFSSGLPFECSVLQEISPCTCWIQEPKRTTTMVSCDTMKSFKSIVHVLQNRFQPDRDIHLKISHSQLDDLTESSINELGMSVSNLNLIFNDLSYMNASTFTGLEKVQYLSLADNKVAFVPNDVLTQMPRLKTLDMGRNRISSVRDEDFQGVPTLFHLVLAGNGISRIESHALPPTITRLHLGHNNLRDLNNSLRGLTGLEWLFLNKNQLADLEGQMPPTAPKLALFHGAHNQLSRLPQEMLNYISMDTIFVNNNHISSFNGVLKKARKLKRLQCMFNEIETLAENEFAESELMEDVQLGYNRLKSINKAFINMKKLRFLDLSFNQLETFSLQEIWGLRSLQRVDISNNRISQLTGQLENVVEHETNLVELHLENNELVSLDGALSGIHGLQRLILHHNKLNHIAPDDLMGLDYLQQLDISYNHITTLEGASKTNLPQLRSLNAAHNYVTKLDDFYHLPQLCEADLSYNQIKELSPDLGNKTQCRSSGGYLIVSLYVNPIICDLEFINSTDTLQRNFTLLKGDSSICDSLPSTTSTTTTTTTTTTTSTTTTTTTTLPPPPLPFLLEAIRNPHPQVIPLKYEPPQSETRVNQETTIQQPPETFEEENASPITLPTFIVDVTTQVPPTLPPATIEAPRAINNEEVTEILHPPIIVKQNDGQVLTLVIPMENGVINKDHSVDQYNQEPNEDSLNQTNRSATISNIEIIDINPLPNDSPSLPLREEHIETETRWTNTSQSRD